MNVVSKLTLTLVMLAIGAAPALSLHGDTFLPAGEFGPWAHGPARADPSLPEAEPAQHQEHPPAEVAIPVVAIPQSELEWAAWTALRNGEDGLAADPADAVEVVETPVAEPEPVGWDYDEPEDAGWVYGEQGDEDVGSVYGEPEVQPDEPDIEPDDDAVDDGPDEDEDGDGLLGILG